MRRYLISENVDNSGWPLWKTVFSVPSTIKQVEKFMFECELFV